MKRVIGLFVVIVVFCACKKNQPSTESLPLLKAAKCITLDDFDKLVTNKEKAEWLVKQGNLVCDSILYAREVDHEVAEADVKVPADAKNYVIDWVDFEKIIGTTIYEKYVGFVLNEQNDVVKIEMVPGYLEDGITYSVPLFRSIGLKYNFEDKSELAFVRAMVKDNLTIVIRFKNAEGKYVYYDFNENPE